MDAHITNLATLFQVLLFSASPCLRGEDWFSSAVGIAKHVKIKNAAAVPPCKPETPSQFLIKLMISVSNVSMRYGAKILFDEVSTAFTPGKRYGLTGPNGAGKTT